MSESTRSGRALGPNRPDFLYEEEAFDRRMEEIVEDVEEPVKGETIVFRGTGVPVVWVKRYFHSEEGVEGFLRDYPEVPADWVDDYLWVEATTGEPPPDAKIEVVQLPRDEAASVDARGKLTLIAAQARDLPEIERNMGGWPEEARLAFPDEWREHMQELGRIGGRLRSGDLDEWGVRGVRTAHRRAAGDIESRIAGWPEEAKQRLPEQWIKQVGQLRRVQGWLESGQVKDEETEQLYQKAIAELEKALPVIRRLGLAEPSTNL